MAINLPHAERRLREWRASHQDLHGSPHQIDRRIGPRGVRIERHVHRFSRLGDEGGLRLQRGARWNERAPEEAPTRRRREHRARGKNWRFCAASLARPLEPAMATVPEKDETILKRWTLSGGSVFPQGSEAATAPQRLFAAELENLPNLKRQNTLHFRDC